MDDLFKVYPSHFYVSLQGFCLSFLTQLDRSSHPVVQSLIKQHLLGHVNAESMLKQPLTKPQDTGQFCNFEGFWIAMGSKEPVVSTEYVLTASVKANLKDLGRVVSSRWVYLLPEIWVIVEYQGSFKSLKCDWWCWRRVTQLYVT